MLKLNDNDVKHVQHELHDSHTDGMDCDDTGTTSLTDISVSCTSDGTSNIKSKAVVFRNELSVMIIPNRLELGDIVQDLWWSKSDFGTFKNEANIEVYEFMREHQFSLKESLSHLYQPSNLKLHFDELRTKGKHENANAVLLTRDPFDEVWFRQTLDTLFMDMGNDSLLSELCMSMNTAI